MNLRIRTADNSLIRFKLYREEAPITCAAFISALPFSTILVHARTSGQEIWTDDVPVLDIIQENASVFTVPGEIVIGPLKPVRAKTTRCLGIYYGEGKGLDSCNIFGKVLEEDMPLLLSLGEAIWKNGRQKIFFEAFG